MPVRRLAIVLALAAVARPAWAKGKDDEESSDDSSDNSSDDSGDDSSDDSGEDAPKPKPKAKAKAKASSEDEEGGDDKKPASDDERKKQDLSGHDLGTNKKANEFEKDRFFVDKVDTEKTENGTLVQGSLTASTFLYTESGGIYTNQATNGTNTGPSRMFGDLRLQTDFRHIKASRWEARIDGRIRMVNTPDNVGAATPNNHIQSGLTGQNEYDIREAWLIRSGSRSDVFLGRQYIPDLGGLKIDGLRIDYASSEKFTFLGFGGLYPLRGSRSIDTDYAAPTQTVAAGFGAAYRTPNTYGSIGGVALVPFNKEQPRIYATSSGYLRSGPKLDLYHFALIDLYGSAGFQITNLSGGINYKPSPRLRLTASVNRVDTETLNLQANTFLQPGLVSGDAGTTTPIQNEWSVIRLATNQARAGVSAGLGTLQRFELSTAITFRYRPAFTLTSPAPMNPLSVDLPAAQSVEVWASLIDRRSIKDARIGIDFSNTFGVGSVAYQRNTSYGLRAFVGHDIKNGQGEWEAEVAYSAMTDSTIPGMTCGQVTAGTNVFTDVKNCFGASSGTILSVGGQIYYRLNASWFALGSIYVSQISNKSATGGMVIDDPAVLSITGFARLAYRF